MKGINYLFVIFLLFALNSFEYSLAQTPKFNLTLDAGHGGHDSGALGSISKEKSINLGVVLKLGGLISANCKDVNLVYTRNTDVFIPLQERADIANRNNSNLFISVHTNSAKSTSAYGAEVYTLGLAKSKANLDVAMKENAVILLEDDYKTKYKGFDPNSVESYIMFEFMQDNNMESSLSLATKVEDNFVKGLKRYDRGVRQAGFWVLHRTACPSILVELGFISNKQEEKFLASDAGQEKLAKAIYNAFLDFKSEYDKKLGRRVPAGEKPARLDLTEDVQPERSTAVIPETVQKKIEPATDKKNDIVPAKTDNTIASAPSTQKSGIPVFRVQFYSAPEKLSNNDPMLVNVQELDSFREGGLYKYTSGNSSEYKEILKIKDQLKKRFPDAFIIAFMGEKKMSVREAMEWKP